ncbi:conserved hypothetical protein [Verticillium alfalfae VaMs.102]|uniref:GTP cyclohydrolase N-terminal domain-containing protein n=1 Tax=Verticillium alfalfae (strain VaMs.102 / ATCC MYA-4576 / FGSC 10136) TaxID=526221 RepID=C9S889_VERA1|nr:conserved hypothetical protein [Verticillium alfalfae VaMs.102]EEY13899.1 conserved hypothetical protein [Verticillium alfalfae VaMs.102]
MSDPSASAITDHVGLGDVLSTLKSIQLTQASLVTAVESLSRTVPQAATGATIDARSAGPNDLDQSLDSNNVADLRASQHHVATSEGPELQAPAVPSSPEQRSGFTSRIVLTPDFTNTEPASRIGPFPQWGDEKKIVAMDPWGHLAPWLFKDTIENENVDIRPTIAITKAHMKLPELAESVKSGRL